MQIIIPRQHHGSVIANDRLTPKIYYVRLQLPEALAFTPGQYGSFLIDTFRRPMSFASLPGTCAEFIIDVSPGGIASQYVTALTVGNVVTFLAPYGRFVVNDTTKPIVFIAAGSGIAPIRAMILDLLNQPPVGPITLFFGNRSPENMFFLEEFTAYAARYPTFTFIPASSTAAAAWDGAVGHISDVATEHNQALVSSEIYVCGGPVMVAATLAMLAAHGVPPEQIHMEKFV